MWLTSDLPVDSIKFNQYARAKSELMELRTQAGISADDLSVEDVYVAYLFCSDAFLGDHCLTLTSFIFKLPTGFQKRARISQSNGKSQTTEFRSI